MTEQKQYDVAEVLAALEAAVAERGEDYVYVNEDGESPAGCSSISCQYTHHVDTPDATPGCIVGLVYFNLTGNLVPVDQNSATINCGVGSPHYTFTSGAVAILSAAQLAQDAGATWGQALAEAREAAEG